MFFFPCTSNWEGGQGTYYKKNQFDEQPVFSQQLKKKILIYQLLNVLDFFLFVLNVSMVLVCYFYIDVINCKLLNGSWDNAKMDS